MLCTLLLQARGSSRPCESFGALVQALRDGTAMAKFREMVDRQGGDITMIDNYTDPSWHPATNVMPVNAVEAGIVKSIDALSTYPGACVFEPSLLP